uniref:Uncharacterized protein n=1 Tax=Romanomermis culicivorax TaxID=13658 RepID=A0A915HPL5_ROMCU
MDEKSTAYAYHMTYKSTKNDKLEGGVSGALLPSLKAGKNSLSYKFSDEVLPLLTAASATVCLPTGVDAARIVSSSK